MQMSATAMHSNSIYSPNVTLTYQLYIIYC